MSGPVTLKPLPDDRPEPHASRGARVLGEAGVDAFFRRDWTMASFRRFLANSNEPMEALDVSSIAMTPWTGLKQLLRNDNHEAELLAEFVQYKDAYTEQFTCSAVPLVLFCANAQAYVGPDHPLPWLLSTARFGADALDELMLRFTAEHDDSWSEPRLDRILQVLLGTGYSRSHLPAAGDSRLTWQFVELTNGDVLLLAGYEWFPN